MGRGVLLGYNLEEAIAVVGGLSKTSVTLCRSCSGPVGQLWTQLDLLAVLGSTEVRNTVIAAHFLQYHQTSALKVHLVSLSSFHASEIVFDSVDFFFFLLLGSWLKTGIWNSIFSFPRR